MNLLACFQYFNQVIALPATIIFFGAGIILTLKLRFIQFRGFPRLLKLVRQQGSPSLRQGSGGQAAKQENKTINPFHAMFAAMATTIGMGNIVGPTIAIYTGGPGALFWLLVYIFFASATKFTEVTFGLYTRVKMADGSLVGGPMQYLKLVHPALAYWYIGVMMFLFVYWSGLQANTLAQIFAQEAIPVWVIGAVLACITFLVLQGGASRVGSIASRLVPIMFVLYVTFALFILLRDLHALTSALSLVAHSILSPTAAMGGFAGATVLKAMQSGSFQAIFISEAGLGTSSIAHAMSDAKRPTDQGILALYSMGADAFLSSLSGLLVLVTGVWMSGSFRSTLIYEVFKMNSPLLGRFVLIGAVTLFVLTTIIGNIFNGTQTVTSIAQSKRWVRWYLGFAITVVFLGPIAPVRLIWEVMDTLLFLVAVPNLIALLILAHTRSDVIND
jgi:AGCS family alanine or glycine:cation symporter